MPPNPRHHKLTRKDLKQPDEFINIVDSARDFFFNNLKQVAISAAVVFAAGAIAVGTYYYEAHRDRLAGERFSTALAALSAKQYKSAEDQFTALATEEPSRRIGKLSRFYLANAYIGANDLEHARDALASFVAEEHDPVFLSLALSNLGVVYERMGDFSKAAGAYREAAMVPGPEQMRAQLDVARMMLKQGDKNGAIAAYREFLAAHPYAEQRQDVLESLAMLGAGPQTASAGAPGASSSTGAASAEIKTSAGNLPVALPPAAASSPATH